LGSSVSEPLGVGRSVSEMLEIRLAPPQVQPPPAPDPEDEHEAHGQADHGAEQLRRRHLDPSLGDPRDRLGGPAAGRSGAGRRIVRTPRRAAIPDLAPKTIEYKRARLRTLRRATVRARALAGVVLAIEAAIAVPPLFGWIHV
jgi:hypothetical protein